MAEKCPRLRWWVFGTAALVGFSIIIAASLTAKNNQFERVASSSPFNDDYFDTTDPPIDATLETDPPIDSPFETEAPSEIDLTDVPEATPTPTGAPSLRPTKAEAMTTQPSKSPAATPTTAPNKVPTPSPSQATIAPSVEPDPLAQPSPSPTAVSGATQQTSSPAEAASAPSVEPDPLAQPSAPPTSPPLQVLPFSPMVPTTGPIVQRHEACFVAVNDKAYLIGGRGVKPVNELDTETGVWSLNSNTPIELHHMQCVAVDDSIYILNAWTGNFPYEQNVEQIFVYDTVTDAWSTRTGLPEPRQRGGGSSVLVTNPEDGTREIYVSHGNRGGHGPHSEALTWFDKYNVDLDEWTTNLPDAPNARDHTGGAIVANGMLCVAGGRDSGAEGYLNKPVLATDCYNFETGSWEVKGDIPQGRAGSAYGTTCDGRLVVAGGEGFNQAWDNVDAFDGSSWTSLSPLEQARHGTGLATFCGCGDILIASGSGNQGGGPELETTERIITSGWNCA